MKFYNIVQAKNLRTDNEYEFRVIAVNKAGQGAPSKSSKAFAAREPVDPPGEPSDIRLIDSTASSLTIGWKGTDKHGGAALEGYEVQIKRVSDRYPQIQSKTNANWQLSTLGVKFWWHLSVS